MAGRSGRPSLQPAAPARKGKAAAARAVAKPTVLGRVFARPGMIVAGATFSAVMTGIVANALILQKGHHPSPLFSPAPAEPAQPAPVPVPAPVPRQALEQPAPPAQAAPASPAPAIEDAPAAKPAAAAHQVKKAAPHAAPVHAATHKEPAAPAHKPAAAPRKDPIAQLLGKAQ